MGLPGCDKSWGYPTDDELDDYFKKCKEIDLPPSEYALQRNAELGRPPPEVTETPLYDPSSVKDLTFLEFAVRQPMFWIGLVALALFLMLAGM